MSLVLNRIYLDMDNKTIASEEVDILMRKMAINHFSTDERRYDVVIFEKSTRKIDSVIGVNMRLWDGIGSGHNTAELRVQTGKERINDRYNCEMVVAGKYEKGDILPQLR